MHGEKAAGVRDNVRGLSGGESRELWIGAGLPRGGLENSAHASVNVRGRLPISSSDEASARWAANQFYFTCLLQGGGDDGKKLGSRPNKAREKTCVIFPRGAARGPIACIRRHFAHNLRPLTDYCRNRAGRSPKGFRGRKTLFETRVGFGGTRVRVLCIDLDQFKEAKRRLFGHANGFGTMLTVPRIRGSRLRSSPQTAP